MNSRQRKLYELQQRMKAARKANEHAVVAEKRKQAAGKAEAAGGSDGGAPRQGSSHKWFEEKQKQKVCLHHRAAHQRRCLPRASLLQPAGSLAQAPPDPNPNLHRHLLQLQEEELKRLGLDPSQAYRLETAETAAAQYKKKEKKPAPSGWCVAKGWRLVGVWRVAVVGWGLTRE
jgi:pre-mRNA-splicing factor SYF2